ncbi:MAG: adenosylcobinamide-phosphate synthase CbiB [Actinomycetota bacterium]
MTDRLATVGVRSGGVAVGLVLDQILGEPPNAVHPVAVFGTAMTALERRIWADRRANGVVYTGIGLTVGIGAGKLARSTALAVTVAVAARELRRVAAAIGDQAADGDLDAARATLPSLVGRDPSELDGSGIASAVIESLAENAVDAMVAPVFWGVVVGAPGALGYRAINTMDAMVGHRSDRFRRFGWAAARLDDAANWVPARLYATAVAVTNPSRGRTVLDLVRRDAGAHPSPNAGVAETAMAAAIGRELGGPLRYGTRTENRPTLGDGPRPEPEDIRRAVAVATRVERAITATLAAAWLVSAGRTAIRGRRAERRTGRSARSR